MEIPVYADVLMAVNFIIDYLLLLFCARLSGRRILREAAPVRGFGRGICLSGDFPAAASILADDPSKGGDGCPDGADRLSLAGLVGACAGWVPVFYRQLSAGRDLPGALAGTWHSGGDLLQRVTYFDVSLGTLLASMTAAYLVLTLYARFRALPSGEHFTAVLTRNGKSLRLPALRDSGNRLTEPFSGDPAAVADLHAVQGLLTAEEIAAVLQAGQGSSFSSDPRLRLVPCRTACGAGAMLAFRPDQLLLEGEEGRQTVEEIWIAVTADPMGSGEFSLLLPAVFSGLPIKEGTKCLQALQS